MKSVRYWQRCYKLVIHEFDYLQMYTILKRNYINSRRHGFYSLFVFLLRDGSIKRVMGCHEIYKFIWSVRDD